MRSSDIRIREAKPKDFVRVAQMHYPAWRQSWQGIVATHVLDMSGTPQNWVDIQYPTTLKRGGWSMWMAESGRQLVGMMLLGPTRPYFSDYGNMLNTLLLLAVGR